MMLRLLVVVSFFLRARAFSSGEGTGCDAHGNYGCSEWTVTNGVPDRLNCIDPNQGQMPWAAAPVRTDKYTLRSGEGDPADDPTVYYPGTYHSIYLSVTDIDWKYRGVLIHAVDQANETVGSWDFTGIDDGLFHSSVACPQAVLHTHADKKPYNSRLTFLAPDAGTGTITFRALIKRGPANTGEFHYPNGDKGDLVLTEGGRNPVRWVAAAKNEACIMTCAKQGLPCSAEEIRTEDASALVFQGIECNGPVLYDCSEVSPTVGTDGTCYLHSSNCPSEADDKTTCTSVGLSDSNNQRFCACSAAFKDALPFLTMMLAALLTGGGEKRFYILVLVVLALGNTAVVRGHNWLETPGRASTEASTLRPCRGRKSSDTHVQLGSNNGDFVMKWATGHSRSNYLSIIHEDYAYLLALSNYTDMVADYISLAPAGANTASETKYKRYHGIRTSSSSKAFYDGGGDDGRYLREVPDTDPYWIDHPFSREQYLYEYDESFLQNDMRVSYNSDKYPWLLFAAEYVQLSHQPIDFDVALLTLPDDAPPGHYIVNWKWSGYYDCVDIIKHEGEVPVNETYGVDVGGHRWSRIDHCQYVGAKEIYSSCEFYSDNIDSLIQEVEDDPYRFRYDDDARVGINCVKTKNPANVINFQKEINIPWENNTCALSGMTRLYNETETRSEPDWTKWSRSETSSTRCVNTLETVTTTLQKAVYACGVNDCEGISWLKSSASMFTGEHEFILCEDFSGAVSDSDYDSFEKVAFVATGSSGPMIDISFQRPTSTATNDYTDTGAVFGSNGDQTYGWNCDTSSLMNRVTPESADNTYVTNIQRPCDSGERRQWAIQLPDGHYQVSTRHGRGAGSMRLKGCFVQNIQLEPTTESIADTTTEGARLVYTNQIQVTGGNLTVQGENFCRSYCNILNRIQIQRIDDEIEPVWGPPETNPWLQQSFEEPQAIGAVRITLPDDCRRFHFYRGTACDETYKEGGFLNDLANEGAVIRVSNNSCVGNTCDGEVCKIVDKAEKCTSNHRITCPSINQCDPIIQCNGAVGRYVSVQLPGSNRILDFDITVDKFQPDVPDDGFICYSLLARTQTNTQPEFEISHDPDDPVFYSTCFVREKNIKFLAEMQTGNINSAQFKFQDRCISCETLQQNLEGNNTALTTWEFTDQCVDCSNAEALEWNIGSSNELPTDIPILAISSLVVVAAGLFAGVAFYRSRKHRAQGKTVRPAMETKKGAAISVANSWLPAKPVKPLFSNKQGGKKARAKGNTVRPATETPKEKAISAAKAWLPAKPVKPLYPNKQAGKRDWKKEAGLRPTDPRNYPSL